MGLLRGDVRYHVPRDRSAVPAVLVGALVVVTLVSAQLSIAGEPSRSAPPAAAGTLDPAGAASTPEPSTPEQSTPEPSTPEPSTPQPSTPGPSAQSPERSGSPVLAPRVEVTFPVGSDAPSGDADALLGPVVQALLADPSTRVRLVGHAEPSNDPVLEEQLSARRAQTVLDLLSDRGMPAGRADVFAAGASQAGGSLSGTDRRVTVEVVPG